MHELLSLYTLLSNELLFLGVADNNLKYWKIYTSGHDDHDGELSCIPAAVGKF